VVDTRQKHVVEREQRRTRPTPQQKGQVCLESSRKNSTDAEVGVER
jgi:hypothetical protein